MVDTQDISLVVSKTKVAPIKKLTIPRLELCGAQIASYRVKTLFNRPLTDVYAWTDSTIVLRFTGNCLARLGKANKSVSISLTLNCMLLRSTDDFKSEIASLQSNKPLPALSALHALHPFLDKDGILRVSGRQEHSKLSYSNLHPIILHGRHSVTKLLVSSELCSYN